MAVVLMQGAEIPSYQDEPVVVGKVEAGSAAERAGIRPGDRIVAVDGEDVADVGRASASAIGTQGRSRRAADASCATAAKQR